MAANYINVGATGSINSWLTVGSWQAATAISLSVNASIQDQYIESITLSGFELFTTDFTEASPLDDWTKVWQSASIDLSIIAAANDARVGAYDLNFDALGVAGNRKYVSYDPPGTVTDCEVLTLLELSDVSTDSESIRIYIRASGSEGSETSYLLSLSNNNILLSRYVGGTSTAITFESCGYLNAKSSWIRFNVTGTSLKVKIWEYDSIEPAEWCINETDSSIASGTVGLGAYPLSANFDVMYFAVDTTGATIDVPTLTYGTVDNKLNTINLSTFSSSNINYARLMPIVVPPALDGYNLTQVAWRTGGSIVSNVRIAVYKGSDKTNPTDAVLVEDFGEITPTGINTFQTHTLTTPENVSSGNVVYVAIKGNDSNTAISYTEYKGNAAGLIANDSGRWAITAGESIDETVAWSANLSGDTISQDDYWYIASASFAVVNVIELVVADSYQLQYTEDILLTHVGVAPADSYQEQLTENVTIAIEILVADSYQLQYTENVTVTLNIAVADSYQLQYTEAILLSHIGVTPADSYQEQLIENINLIVGVVVAESYQLQCTENVLIQGIQVVIADSVQLQYTEDILLQGVPIFIDDSYQLQYTENVDLSGFILVVVDSYQLQYAESPVLNDNPLLVIVNSTQTQYTENILLQAILILVNDSLQEQYAENILLTGLPIFVTHSYQLQYSESGFILPWSLFVLNTVQEQYTFAAVATIKGEAYFNVTMTSPTINITFTY